MQRVKWWWRMTLRSTHDISAKANMTRSHGSHEEYSYLRPLLFRAALSLAATIGSKTWHTYPWFLILLIDRSFALLGSHFRSAAASFIQKLISLLFDITNPREPATCLNETVAFATAACEWGRVAIVVQDHRYIRWTQWVVNTIRAIFGYKQPIPCDPGPIQGATNPSCNFEPIDSFSPHQDLLGSRRHEIRYTYAE